MRYLVSLTLILSALHSAFAANVTVKIPVSEAKFKSSNLSYYSVTSRHWGSSTKQKKIKLDKLNDTSLTVERRTDNGAAGSGVIYQVDYEISNSSGVEIISFTSKENPKTYQEGLFGKFPVPNFTDQDLIKYLSSGDVRFSIEENSNFSVDSTKANFERLANGISRSGKNYGQIEIDGEKVRFSYKVYPYRNGSKVVVETTINNREVVDGVIDYSKKVAQFKKMIKEIVNS